MMVPLIEAPPSTETGGRSRPLMLAGAVTVVAGLVAALVVFVVGQGRTDRAVENLARAPVGCDTTLEFSGTGSFVVYVETVGRIEQLEGGCDAPTAYDRRGAGTPDVSIELRGPAGEEVALEPTTADGYATDAFVGEAAGEVRIDAAGRHLLRVTSDDEDFVVSVGRDLSDVATPFTLAAVMVGLAGLVGGATLVAVAEAGSRRGPHDDRAVDEMPPFEPDGRVPAAPPLAPPPPGAVVSPPPTDPLPPPPPPHSGG